MCAILKCCSSLFLLAIAFTFHPSASSPPDQCLSRWLGRRLPEQTMPIPLPNLDDRRWQDLTQEGIPLIRRFAPQWTDLNTHDPGITLMEMLAWLTESMVYQLNQIPDRFKWKFLSLIGYRKRGPQPAWTVLAFQPISPAAPFEVPEGVQFKSSSGVQFSTARAVALAPVSLDVVQGDLGDGSLRDYSRDWSDGLPIPVFGTNPQPGAALYFGFDTIPTASPIALWLWFNGPGHTWQDREQIISEDAAQRAACQRKYGWPCNESALADPSCNLAIALPVPAHHSAHVVWEFFATGAWVPLFAVSIPGRPMPGEVVDDTRSLTLDGMVEVNLPASITKTAVGTVATPHYYLRCRLDRGAYDAPILLAGIQPNAVAAMQHVPLWHRLAIAASVLPIASAPAPGDVVSLQFTISNDLTIKSLAVQSPPVAGLPSFEVLNYLGPVAGNPGSITIKFAVLGRGTAVPLQQVFVPHPPLQNCCVRLYTHDGATWMAWTQVADFEASKRTDLAYTLDATTGQITCGDGEHGRVFPENCTIVLTGWTTLADNGNVTFGQSWDLSPSPINDVLLSGVSAIDRTLLASAAANERAAMGGLPASSLSELEGEAAQIVHGHQRILELATSNHQTTLDQIPKDSVLALPAPTQAVNLVDTERLALNVPGTAVGRARAWADTDPTLPGIYAAGVVTVVVLPAMPIAAPQPSRGLMSAVKRYLDLRRIICTRIEVAPPVYVLIAITASIQASIGASTSAVKVGILAALQNFLDPRHGGPAGLGWPFGRRVYRAELLDVLANVPGVDHVNSMTISADGGTAQCGDISLCPTFLVSSGSHRIQVVNA
jgi:hypothetical protein